MSSGSSSDIVSLGRSNSSLATRLERISETGPAAPDSSGSSLSLAEAQSHLEDLIGLVVEYLERSLQNRSKWLTKKILAKLERELQQNCSPVPTCRLSEFYCMFQQRGIDKDEGVSKSLRRSYGNKDQVGQSGSTDTLDSKASGKSRQSTSSDTVDTKKTEGVTEVSFDLSQTTGEEDGPSTERPLCMPLGKAKKLASREDSRFKANDTTDDAKKRIGMQSSRADDGSSISPRGEVHRFMQDHGSTATARSSKKMEDRAVQVSMETLSFSSTSGRPPPLPGSPRSPNEAEQQRPKRASSHRSRSNGPQMENGNTLSATPMLSAFVDTPYETMRTSMEWTMSHWNPLKYSSCCPFHSSCCFARVIIHDLARDPCIPLWSPLTDWQCKRCFCMNHREKDTCHMCQESRPPTVSSDDRSDGASTGPSLPSSSPSDRQITSQSK